MRTVNDRQVLIGLGAAILAEAVAVLLWAGAAAERLSQLETRAAHTTILIERTARLEEKATSIQFAVHRIERTLEQRREPTQK